MLEYDKTVYICKLEDQLEEAHDLLGKCQTLLRKYIAEEPVAEVIKDAATVLAEISAIIGD